MLLDYSVALQVLNIDVLPGRVGLPITTSLYFKK